MKTACVLVRGNGHQPQWGTAFATGLKRHGVNASITRTYFPSDLLVVWGVRRPSEMNKQRSIPGQICVLERGYLGDRFKWTSVSFGGKLNGRGEFRGTSDDPLRFNRHHANLLKPWQERREKIALLIGQVPGDMSLAGANMPLWYSLTARQLVEAGYKVLFREHPRAVEQWMRMKVTDTIPSTGTLAEALAGASLCVTYNSNTAVEAVLAGVPTISSDIGSMAWEVTSHDVNDDPVMPDRLPWAARLAWKQWTEAEMRSGSCWEAIKAEPMPVSRAVERSMDRNLWM